MGSNVAPITMSVAPEMATEELMKNVEVYNYVPPGLKSAYSEALLCEYAHFWNEGAQ